MKTIDEIKEQIIPILLRHNVGRASLFGSIVNGNMNEKSDIDILINLPIKYSLFDMLTVKFELEDTLGKKVDLVEFDGIKKSLKNEILSSQVKIIS